MGCGGVSEGSTALGFVTARQGWDAHGFEMKTQFSFEFAVSTLKSVKAVCFNNKKNI